MNEYLAWFYISQLTCFGTCPDKLNRLIESAGGPEGVYEWAGADLYALGVPLSFREIAMMQEWRDETKLECGVGNCLKAGIRFVARSDEDFPGRLMDIPDPPAGLYVKGELPDGKKRAAAMIGARKCTSYGREMALFFGTALGKAGIPVISGMAIGIDGHAMRGALAGNGTSFAVLAGGADLCYPRENIGLYRELTEHGGILSDKPPGYRGKPYDFPFRNRLISGLSDAVIVLEAAVHSGTSITVGYALEQGKEVFALPGRVGDRLSDGCNRLIQNGAQILTSPEDILQLLGADVGEETVKTPAVTLSKEEKIISDLIGRTPVPMEELLQKSAFPLTELASILVRLEIRGIIRKRDLEGYVRVI